ncbi:MAG: hypothetical protein GXY83_42225 [Rhodopirellula sp.]|nr:hypothetical protein [Rhodopirellula sp.]
MLPPWLDNAAFIVLCILLAPHLLAPFLIGCTLRFRTPAEVVPIDPRREPLPDSVRQYFDQAYHALTDAGFELVGVMALPSLLPNVQSLLALYANRAACDMAMSTFIVAEGGRMQARYVEFVTRFSDGVVVQTNNSNQLGSFKPLPGQHTLQFWDVQDFAYLYQLHRLAVDRFRRSGQPVFRLDSEFGGDAAEFVSRVALEESFEEQIGTGYLVRTANGYRPSVKGAWLMSWQELWPWKAVRRWQTGRRARQFLREERPTQKMPA